MAIAATAVLAVRSAVGAFHILGTHTVVDSPFTAESIFWCVFLGLLWLAGSSVVDEPLKATAATFPRGYLLVALAIVALAFAHNLADPFLSDDYIIVSGPPFRWSAFFAALHRAGGDGSFRPLGTVYYQSLIAFAGARPVLWHAVGLGLHLLNCALTFVIAWQLWRDRTASTVASLVFGLHGTRPEAALWTAGNCDLLACSCVLGAISLTLSKRSTAALLLAAVGILFKESAYALPLIAFCFLWPHSKKTLYGFFATAGALFAWRWHLFNGPGGYVDPTSGRPAILSLHVAGVAKALLIRIWAILLFPVNWDAPLSWWLPLAIAACGVGLIWLAHANRSDSGGMRSTQLRLIAATCCAVLPAIHLALIGQSDLGSRILYLPCAMFALLIGSLAVSAGRKTTIAAGLMIAGMAGILSHNLNAWHETAASAPAICASAKPDTRPPLTMNGVPLFQNGFRECVALVNGTSQANRSSARPQVP